MKKVVGRDDHPLFDVEIGKECTVLKSYWFNGEGWYLLKDGNGKAFESPDIFWDDKEKTRLKW